MARKHDNPVALLHARKETNFQNTEIGPIPRDWEVGTIANEFKFLGNNTLSREQLTVVGSVQNVHYGDIHVKFPEVLDLSKFSLPYINESICRRAKEFLRDGDIVMADTAEDESVGKSCEIINVGDRKVEGGLHTFVLRSYKSYYNGFLGYLINSTLFHNHIIPLLQGTKVYSITKSDLKTLKVIYPPLEEQKRIAEVLSHFDQHIENLSALLEKKKQIKSAAMHELLTFPLSIKGQKEKDVQWDFIANIFEMRNGYTPSTSNADYWENGTIPWFKMEDIRANGGILKDSILHITPEAVNRKGLFKSGSIIMATTATIGEHALLIADSLANQQFTNFKIRESLTNIILPMFAYYYFFIIDSWCKLNVNIGTFAAVNIELLKVQPFPIPPIDEQRRIVRILSNMDKEIGALEQLIEKYQQLKQGAMQELLTGKTRLL